MLQDEAFLCHTPLVVSQLGVVESIPVTFGGPRRFLDALEQLLSLRGPQMRYLEVYGFSPKIAYFRQKCF